MQKKRMEGRGGTATAGPVWTMVKALLMMYIITFFTLGALAFVLYKFQPAEMVLQIWILAVYILSGLAGGFYLGKKRKNQKYVWGLIGGILYFVCLFIVSLILHRGLDTTMTELLTTGVLCMASGTIGGMLA